MLNGRATSSAWASIILCLGEQHPVPGRASSGALASNIRYLGEHRPVHWRATSGSWASIIRCLGEHHLFCMLFDIGRAPYGARAGVSYTQIVWQRASLNSLTSIDMSVDSLVTLQTAVQEVPCSIPGSGKYLYLIIFVLLLLCSYFFVQKQIFVMIFCIPFLTL